MKASELIGKLQCLIDEHGDLRVVDCQDVGPTDIDTVEVDTLKEHEINMEYIDGTPGELVIYVY